MPRSRFPQMRKDPSSKFRARTKSNQIMIEFEDKSEDLKKLRLFWRDHGLRGNRLGFRLRSSIQVQTRGKKALRSNTLQMKMRSVLRRESSKKYLVEEDKGTKKYISAPKQTNSGGNTIPAKKHPDFEMTQIYRQQDSTHRRPQQSTAEGNVRRHS